MTTTKMQGLADWLRASAYHAPIMSDASAATLRQWASEVETAAQADVPLSRSRVGRVYLAGPMTGIADYNFPAFHAAAARLRSEGFEVINPADHGVVEGAEHGDHLRFDLAKLATCESIAVLPGWSKSRGATLEVYFAQWFDMVVRYLDGAERPEPPKGTTPLSEERIREILKMVRRAANLYDEDQADDYYAELRKIETALRGTWGQDVREALQIAADALAAAAFAHPSAADNVGAQCAAAEVTVRAALRSAGGGV